MTQMINISDETALAALWKQALTSPNNSEILDAVRRRAQDLLRFMEQNDIELTEADNRVLDGNPEWVAKVYHAVAGAPTYSPHEQRALDGLVSAKQEDDGSVGTIFKNGLLRDLPPNLLEWNSWFAAVPRLEAAARDYLLPRADVQAALPACEPLVARGITPLTVFYATEAVRVVVDRSAWQHAGFDQTVFLTTSRGRAGGKSDALDPDAVLDEIRAMAECRSPAAAALLPWLIAVAGDRAFLFNGLEVVSRDHEGIRLRRTGGDMTLEERWSPMPSAASETASSYERELVGVS